MSPEEKISLFVAITLLVFPFLHGSFRLVRNQFPSPLPPSTSPRSPDYIFTVREKIIQKMCNPVNVLTINDMSPGPEIRVTKKDQTVIVLVKNDGKHPITIHWHGVKNPRNPWSDGPEFVAQCPIQSGHNFTYEIRLSDEVGTIWWHAHSNWDRATVHGAIVVAPDDDTSPVGSHILNNILIFGSWYNKDVDYMYELSRIIGQNGTLVQFLPDAYTINGLIGSNYSCGQDTQVPENPLTIEVNRGKTHLLRIVNAAMVEPQYFGITDHDLIVVARDGALVQQFHTKYILVWPGQTMDVQFVANATGKQYIMAFSSFSFGVEKKTRGYVLYKDPVNPVDNLLFPPLPAKATDNSIIATQFTRKLKSVNDRSADVPQSDDPKLKRYIIAVGEKDIDCPTCTNKKRTRPVTYLSYQSFKPYKNHSILEAYYYGTQGVYDPTFPTKYPEDESVEFGQKVIEVDYGTPVEIVFQTNGRSHPMHLHGYNFFLVGMGSENFNEDVDPANYDTTFPPQINTAAVYDTTRRGLFGEALVGWTALRFYANNPGVWIMHCHLEFHVSRGMATAIIVKDGSSPDQKMLDPPLMPKCSLA